MLGGRRTCNDQGSCPAAQRAGSIQQSIVAAESNFDATVVSSRGAIGLMQLMPSLAMEYGVDPRIPEQNIDGGTRYLKVLIQRYQKSREGFSTGHGQPSKPRRD